MKSAYAERSERAFQASLAREAEEQSSGLSSENSEKAKEEPETTWQKAKRKVRETKQWIKEAQKFCKVAKRIIIMYRICTIRACVSYRAVKKGQ
jgi:uncharacterized FlaG/YvyC family protein